MPQTVEVKQSQQMYPGSSPKAPDEKANKQAKLFLDNVKKKQSSNDKQSSPTIFGDNDEQSLITGNDRKKLKDLLNEKQKFQKVMKQVYGDDVGSDQVENMRKTLTAWANGKNGGGKPPRTAFLTDSEMNGAKGAYFAGDNKTPETIFLNKKLLGNAKNLKDASPETRRKISKAALEELAHAMETRIRPGGYDAPGDEGARFVHLLTGDADAKRRITQDDHGTVSLNGKELAVEMRSDSEASYQQAAKKLHDMVRDHYTDEEFNNTWEKWGFTDAEKAKVFAEMDKLPGGVRYYLDAECGRKFTQPINEFAQWATAHRGGDVADYIASKGNDWNDWDYNQAYEKWIEPAKDQKAFFDRTTSIGFEQWYGLDGTAATQGSSAVFSRKACTETVPKTTTIGHKTSPGNWPTIFTIVPTPKATMAYTGFI